ncbi:hypothetical protein SARC_02267 [Sphaeroforma arctica JP610]|uniref:Uncharacterized protein n=1 Tax=Sphaeroforma arctica JP610 TaxID=667725 RepID=A0A0L0G970_9EUKA|nr:hypothetical protein SARC_02267 [Sphaeroforma arctica JP610]KNC85545.1 hypothetical protein SARC_02267 [Sphaeroforma arctica JP610]|eukprot:XP_014159447.1 hypothetical protein SARC_02267 [Sphaeroforma arctica JP610]
MYIHNELGCGKGDCDRHASHLKRIRDRYLDGIIAEEEDEADDEDKKAKVDGNGEGLVVIYEDTQKDQFNQICKSEGMVPKNDGFECCQWSKQCGFGSDGQYIPKCMVSNCCKEQGSNPRPEPTNPRPEPTNPGPEPTNPGPEPTNPPQSDNIRTCGSRNIQCDASKDMIINFLKECCKEEGKCGNLEKCSEDTCCMLEADLPPYVMTCETKLDVNENAFKCDAGDDVRTDGFLCCQWTPRDTWKTIECAPFGATIKCLERSCCVRDE